MSIILLDTSVLIKMKGTQPTVDTVNALLSRHRNTEIYVPSVACYELLRTCNDSGEYKRCKKVLSDYKKLHLYAKFISFAACYYNVITSHKVEGRRCCQANQLSDVDVFMGAITMMTDAIICTTDRNDYPFPFFTELDIETTPSREKICLLKADRNSFAEPYCKIIGRFKK